MQSPIIVEVTINAPIEKVWQYWTEPEHITQWNFASNDWQCPRATNDLKVGGTFSYRMEAKDGSVGFDMGGSYTLVDPMKKIEYDMAGRNVSVEFIAAQNNSCIVRETFDPENENPLEMQRGGWQAILENFKKHVE